MATVALLLCTAALPLCAGEDAPAAPEPQIHWRPWAPEAFAEARRRERPVALLVEAAWSHAERVLEAGALADPGIQTLLNTEFVPIRVDRDRRPDVDRRYQEAARGLGEAGGWPLWAVVTPEGETLFAGTFSTLEDDFVRERPGVRTVLDRIARDWVERRADLRAKAHALEEKLRAAPGSVSEPRASASGVYAAPSRSRLGPAPVPADILARVSAATREAFSAASGTGAPRFPQPVAVEMLLAHYARTGEVASLTAARDYLAALVRGGLHDRLGGGFHRYSLDGQWRRPRFEKLLAPNAELLIVCLRLWQATGDEEFRGAAEGVLRWSGEVLRDPRREAFRGAQWASSGPGDEGVYYTWTLRDVEQAVREDGPCALVKMLYGVSEWGALAETAPHRNVLAEGMPLAQAAARSGVELAAAGKALAEALGRMRAFRRSWGAPPLDEKVLVDANARMVSAGLLAAAALGRDEPRTTALKTLDRLLAQAVDPKRGAGHVVDADGTVSYPCLASDEAALAVACQDAYLATGEQRYLGAATAALGRLDERFRDPEDGAYWDRAMKWPDAPETLGRLTDPHQPCEDAPGPSVNALAASAHQRQAVLTGEEAHAERARQTLAAIGGGLEALGPSGAGLTGVADVAQQGLVVVLVEGAAGDQKTVALCAAARRAFVPQKLVWRIEPGERAVLARFGPVASASRLESGPAAHVFSGTKWVASTGDPAKLGAVVESAARGR